MDLARYVLNDSTKSLLIEYDNKKRKNKITSLCDWIEVIGGVISTIGTDAKVTKVIPMQY